MTEWLVAGLPKMQRLLVLVALLRGHLDRVLDRRLS
jgi:hypothetical protein